MNTQLRPSIPTISEELESLYLEKIRQSASITLVEIPHVVDNIDDFIIISDDDDDESVDDDYYFPRRI